MWPTQAWYPSILHMLIAPPVLLPWTPKLLCGPQEQSHPLVVNHTLQLAAWHVCANPCKREEFQEMLPSSSWQLGGRVQTQFITPPGTNGIYDWCDERKIDSFCPTLANITTFLAHSFDKGLEYQTINTYRSALSGVLPPIVGFPVGSTL